MRKTGLAGDVWKTAVAASGDRIDGVRHIPRGGRASLTQDASDTGKLVKRLAVVKPPR
jgi:hypothetical protein